MRRVENGPKITGVEQVLQSRPVIPDVAAGIPCIGIPHAAVSVARENLTQCRRFLYELPLQREFALATDVVAEDLFPCQGLMAADEYPSVSAPTADAAGKWRVLVLTNPCAHPGALLPVGPASHGDQIQGLRILADPPGDIAEHLDLRIKVHPAFPELPLFAAAADGLADKVLPANTALASALEDTDLVVGLNYFGSALIHGIQAGRPLVHFLTHPPANYDPAAQHFLPAGPATRSADDFWQTIRDFFTHPGRAREMARQTAHFRQTMLSTEGHPPVGEAVRRILG